jgi:hypothetical protein
MVYFVLEHSYLSIYIKDVLFARHLGIYGTHMHCSHLMCLGIHLKDKRLFGISDGYKFQFKLFCVSSFW